MLDVAAPGTARREAGAPPPSAANENNSAVGWSPSSWRSRPARQMPAYQDAGQLAEVEARRRTALDTDYPPGER